MPVMAYDNGTPVAPQAVVTANARTGKLVGIKRVNDTGVLYVLFDDNQQIEEVDPVDAGLTVEPAP